MESVLIRAVNAARLQKGGSASEVVTCAAKDVDNPAAGAIPAGTKYIEVLASAEGLIAIGEATVKASLGRPVAAGIVQSFPVLVTGTAADDTVHVQSTADAGTFRLAYVKD